MNRNKKLSNQGKNIYFNACLLPKVPSKEHSPKLVCLANPDILHGSTVSLVHNIVFNIIGVLLTGEKYLMGSVREID
jgi:hypothetical protein